MHSKLFFGGGFTSSSPLAVVAPFPHGVFLWQVSRPLEVGMGGLLGFYEKLESLKSPACGKQRAEEFGSQPMFEKRTGAENVG